MPSILYLMASVSWCHVTEMKADASADLMK